MDAGKSTGVIPKDGKVVGGAGAGGAKLAEDTGAGGGKGAGGGTGGKRKSAEKNVGLADVIDIPVAKPKKKKTKKKDSKQLAENLAILLGTVSNVIGQKNPVWLLAENEVEAIAEPLAEVMEMYVPAEKANEYSAVVQLVAAVGFVIVPRVIVTVQQKKLAKPGKEQGHEKSAANSINKTDSATSNSSAGHGDSLFPALAF